MSQLQETPLNIIDLDQIAIQRVAIQQQRRHFNPKVINAIYWIIYFILFAAVVKVYRNETTIEKMIAKAKMDQIQILNQIQTVQQKLAEQTLSLAKQQQRMKNEAQSTLTNGIQIRNQLMEEYHLKKKIVYIRQKSRQEWGIIRDIPKTKTSWLLAMNNYKMKHPNIHLKREIDQLLATEYQRLSKIYNFSLPEKPICVFVPTINNNQNFRNIYNLQSILNQNYSNYKIVIIDDASTDRNLETIQQFIKDNPISQKIFLVQNKQRQSAIPNIYKAATQYCLPNEIFLIVDGDDELLGSNIFKIFNSVYTTKNLEVAYSNLIESNVHVKPGWSKGYTEQQKQNNMYRDGNMRMYPVRSFNVSTFLKIDPKNLKDDNGVWLKSAYDVVIMTQVLELSCGRHQYIDQYNYLYNYGLGNNDLEIDSGLTQRIVKLMRQRKKNQCPK